jgi:transposase
MSACFVGEHAEAKQPRSVGRSASLVRRFACGAMNADILIDFFKRLIKDAARKVFVILDNLKVHHARRVKDWLADHTEHIEVFYLPSYSPELNPD